MLVFIIPLKSQQVSKSWSRLSKLFERCLKSVCNQTAPDFKVIVVCHEKPELEVDLPQVTYIQVDFPAPNLDNASFGEVRGIGDTDKAKKILVGLSYAAKFQPSHIMVVDADDCVNKYLVELANNHPQCDGWYLKKGYVHEEGSKLIYLNTKNFNQSCGTSIIIKFSLSHLLFPVEDYYNHHNHLLKDGIVLKELPFIGAIYNIKNGENQFMTVTKTKQLKKRENRLLFLIRKVMKYRPILITNGIRREFGLYSIN
ncbi:glycosyltransferase family A protein [Pleurocapsa sp. PCC 7319]|uniref:glycosyltransferase family A protein n=1 Tax=Pleurocapsa sp. PCC 7319 TaxID=118161 RepID=UPI00034BD0AB|nr:glycosyltransferase family A protein [Pleurocapsa sp. PCC 7319]